MNNIPYNILEDFGTQSSPETYVGDIGEPSIPNKLSIVRKKKNSKEPSSSIDNKSDSKFTQFTEFGQGYTVSGKTHRRLESGVYTIDFYEGVPIYTPKNVKSDKWINFRDGFITDILAEIDKFWTKREVFEKYEFLQRRGYMFYGPAGTGKTILIKQIMAKLVENDGIVFFCDHPALLSKGLTYYRQVEPERKITVVFEDIDAIIARYGDSDLLAYLDGEDSNNYVVNIASTNYPEKLDKRIISRPRRFDRVIKIGYPDRNMRSFYFKEKLFIENEELEKWVDASEEFTFAALTELVISVKCLDIEFDVAVKKIQELLENKPHSDDFNSRKMGFGK